MTDLAADILRRIQAAPGWRTIYQLSAATGLSTWTLVPVLQSLISAGQIERSGVEVPGSIVYRPRP